MTTTHNKTFYHMTLKATCGLILDALTGVTIADCRNESDAAEIVSRCNSHEALVKALKAASEWLNDLRCDDENHNENCVVCMVNQALAHAEGRD